jgi:signal transduction histidine kinase/DNA-binding response OmpR family regulator
LQFSIEQGLPSNNIRSITEDLEGNIWLTTDNGISKYDVVQKTFISFNLNDGLPGVEFNTNAICLDYKGNIYTGGLNGLVFFNPEKIQKNNSTNNIVFTALKVGNEYIEPQSNQQILQKNINYAEEITLKNGQNNFTVDFKILNYIKSDKNKFLYTLKGFEKDWNTSNTGSATYTNISAGNYQLIVKGSNNDDVWNSKIATLNIKILPPIWGSWWAYCIYFIGIVLVILFVTRYFLLQAKYIQEKKLQQYKLDFFTNISHEIRTHLTLIISPLDVIIDQSTTKEFMNKQLLYIKKHTEKLSTLVGELLDFRKAETGNVVLNYEKEKLEFLLEEVKSSFQEEALKKGITLQLVVKQPAIFANIDKQHFEKVLTNLVFNAIKFTNQGGTINIELEKSTTLAIIKIRDNGIGIASKYYKNLFNNYFQINNHEKENAGYGIGLALSKSIIELHKGSIEVESVQQIKDQPGSTVFTIKIPLGLAENENQVTKKFSDKTLQETTGFSELHALEESITNPRLLLIEDNDELREFIKDALSTNFNVEEAINGEMGFAVALKTIPDIIISDIMMPEMDGLELCKLVKKNPKTSHIPIILLTAKSSINDQIEGLSHQADVYITKPFNLKLLESQVINLIENRKKLQETYKQKWIQSSAIAVSTTIEDKFLSDLIHTIESNLENIDFTVASLSRTVAMSQPVLYKKLKALTDMSVNDFVKSIRLKKAVSLLQSKQYTIYEVAYMVGFQDRKYFSKEFKKAYGYTPTEYIEQV